VLQTILCLLPIAALLVPLLLRRYPGERVLLALRSPRRSRRAHPRARVRSHGRAVVAAVRGASLIGRSLAVRPPPALRAAS
jgi:hypothetical protein